MPFERWGYKFRGPYTSCDSLQDIEGVYVILCKSQGIWTVLDVGEADDVKERISNHERAECWSRNCSDTIYYSAVYTLNIQQAERMKIEQKIRKSTKPLCSGD